MRWSVVTTCGYQCTVLRRVTTGTVIRLTIRSVTGRYIARLSDPAVTTGGVEPPLPVSRTLTWDCDKLHRSSHPDRASTLPALLQPLGRNYKTPALLHAFGGSHDVRVFIAFACCGRRCPSRPTIAYRVGSHERFSRVLPPRFPTGYDIAEQTSKQLARVQIED